MKSLNCFWRKRARKRIITIHAAAFFAAACYFCFLNLCRATCLFKLLFGRKCPTCGMTRALIALLKGNPERYFSENPFALFTVAAVWTLFHAKSKALKCAAVAALAVNFVCFFFF